VDVVEHRSFSHSETGTPQRVLNGECNEKMTRSSEGGVAVGEGHRSNMAGYLTAGAVSQDAFNVAMADLMSSLSGIPSA
jgi:hypothetical protein